MIRALIVGRRRHLRTPQRRGPELASSQRARTGGPAPEPVVDSPPVVVRGQGELPRLVCGPGEVGTAGSFTTPGAGWASSTVPATGDPFAPGGSSSTAWDRTGS